MTVIGISCGHDANACLIVRDKFVYYSNAERNDRFKGSSSYIEAIKAVIRSSGIVTSQIDTIMITNTQACALPIENEKLFMVKEWIKAPVLFRSDNSHVYKCNSTSPKYFSYQNSSNWFPTPMSNHCKTYDELEALANSSKQAHPRDFIFKGNFKFEGLDISGYFVEHHFAHAISGLVRNKDCQLIISLDGSGHSPELIAKFPYIAGISILNPSNKIIIGPPPLFMGGILYSWASKYCNLSEGKFMGLASYFNINQSFTNSKQWIDLLTRLETLFDSSCKSVYNIKIETITKQMNFILSDLTKYFEGKLVLDYSQITKRDVYKINLPERWKILIAGVVQEVFSRLYIKSIKNQISFFKRKGLSARRVLITGGCVLNCPSNRILCETFPEIDFSFDNACNDEGLSIGAAYVLKFMKGYDSNNNLTSLINTPFLGDHPSHVKEALIIAKSDEQLSYKYSSNLKDDSVIIGNQLLEGKAIVLANGRYESGPRALGNRSLIALAELEKTHWMLNKIKRREYWRPIAPVIREKDFDDFFIGPKNSNMLMTNSVKFPEKLPGTTHVDGSARVQVLHDKSHLLWYLLEYLEEMGHCPVLANTSLNQSEEPLINSAPRIVSLMLDEPDIACAYIDGWIIKKVD